MFGQVQSQASQNFRWNWCWLTDLEPCSHQVIQQGNGTPQLAARKTSQQPNARPLKDLKGLKIQHRWSDLDMCILRAIKIPWQRLFFDGPVSKVLPSSKCTAAPCCLTSAPWPLGATMVGSKAHPWQLPGKEAQERAYFKMEHIQALDSRMITIIRFADFHGANCYVFENTTH